MHQIVRVWKRRKSWLQKLAEYIKQAGMGKFARPVGKKVKNYEENWLNTSNKEREKISKACR